MSGTEEYLPTATAVFESNGQKPALLKAFCDDDDFFFGDMAKKIARCTKKGRRRHLGATSSSRERVLVSRDLIMNTLNSPE